MAQRCTIGNHGACVACGAFVPPASTEHVHIFRRTGGYETLCETCWMITAQASIPVLRCAVEIGVHRNLKELRYALEREQIIVALQLPLIEVPLAYVDAQARKDSREAS